MKIALWAQNCLSRKRLGGFKRLTAFGAFEVYHNLPYGEPLWQAIKKRIYLKREDLFGNYKVAVASTDLYHGGKSNQRPKHLIHGRRRCTMAEANKNGLPEPVDPVGIEIISFEQFFFLLLLRLPEAEVSVRQSGNPDIPQ